ncbi:MAG TPA: Clp protease N-terminal domain-containing protein [Alphaproteobacteria bacterium]|nr:Clp protease N-terminal domain-containing protein [Alphaproteobacteria bacterium]
MNPPEFSNFTPRAQEAYSLAREEAIRLGQSEVVTEHFLLGIIKLGNGVAFNVLKHLELNLENIRAEIEKLAGSGTEETVSGKIRYTPRTDRVFQLAKEEAKTLQHTYIGTEHLLLGLMRETDGPAAKVLDKYYVDIEAVRNGVRKELNPTMDDEKG